MRYELVQFPRAMQALGKRFVGYFLKRFLYIATCFALIFIDRHSELSSLIQWLIFNGRTRLRSKNWRNIGNVFGLSSLMAVEKSTDRSDSPEAGAIGENTPIQASIHSNAGALKSHGWTGEPCALQPASLRQWHQSVVGNG